MVTFSCSNLPDFGNFIGGSRDAVPVMFIKDHPVLIDSGSRSATNNIWLQEGIDLFSIIITRPSFLYSSTFTNASGNLPGREPRPMKPTMYLFSPGESFIDIFSDSILSLGPVSSSNDPTSLPPNGMIPHDAVN